MDKDCILSIKKGEREKERREEREGRRDRVAGRGQGEREERRETEGKGGRKKGADGNCVTDLLISLC